MKKSIAALLTAGLLMAGAVQAEPAAPKATASAPKAAAAKTAGKKVPVADKAASTEAPKADDVWVNGKVYHCPGSKHYGKTKKGEYMSEEQAKAAGAHVAHNRPCEKQ